MSRQSVDRGRCLCADRSPAVTSTEPGQHTRCQAARPEQIVLVNNLGWQGHPLRYRRRVCFHKALNIYLFYMNLFISWYLSSVFPKRVISDRWFLTRHQPSSVSSYPVRCVSFIFLGGKCRNMLRGGLSFLSGSGEHCFKNRAPWTNGKTRPQQSCKQSLPLWYLLLILLLLLPSVLFCQLWCL